MQHEKHQNNKKALKIARNNIDKADNEILKALKNRTKFAQQIAIIKNARDYSSNVFRPAREIAIAKELLGSIDIGTPPFMIEHIWREIITSCTRIQASFIVHAEHGDMFSLRDAIRYHLGFSVPIKVHQNAIDALLDANKTDLIVLKTPSRQLWWSKLSKIQTLDPKEYKGRSILFRFPFVDSLNHPAPEKAYLIGPYVFEEYPFQDSFYSIEIINYSSLKTLKNTINLQILETWQKDKNSPYHILAMLKHDAISKIEKLKKSELTKIISNISFIGRSSNFKLNSKM